MALQGPTSGPRWSGCRQEMLPRARHAYQPHLPLGPQRSAQRLRLTFRMARTHWGPVGPVPSWVHRPVTLAQRSPLSPVPAEEIARYTKGRWHSVRPRPPRFLPPGRAPCCAPGRPGVVLWVEDGKQQDHGCAALQPAGRLPASSQTCLPGPCLGARGRQTSESRTADTSSIFLLSHKAKGNSRKMHKICSTGGKTEEWSITGGPEAHWRCGDF